MSSEYAIEIMNLGKCYQIYDRPSDRLKQMICRSSRQYFKEFWALRDLSFRVKKGKTVGIIGHNGSGKSTLLQLICKTLSPTLGEVKVNGRIAALLELGAGFNQEFTGIENIYLAASLYGLSKKEIDLRFKNIVAFADIGDHIYQPVKTYSSGMYVRLAFAVIAHVDADILVIDEALAVGDAIFTQKCMRFIREFRERGTLFFVSHDIASVLGLCETAIWLDKGRIKEIGGAKDVSESYLRFNLQKIYGQDTKLASLPENNPKLKLGDESTPNFYASSYQIINNLSEANGWKTDAGEIISVSIKSETLSFSGENILQGGDDVKLTVRALIKEDMRSPILGFLVRDKLGQDLFGENTLVFTAENPFSAAAGDVVEAEFSFILPMLQNGDYSIMISLADGDLHRNVQHHWLHDALIVKVASNTIRYGLMGIQFKTVRLGSLNLVSS